MENILSALFLFVILVWHVIKSLLLEQYFHAQFYVNIFLLAYSHGKYNLHWWNATVIVSANGWQNTF